MPKTAGTSYTAFLAGGLGGEHLIERLGGGDVAEFVDGLDPAAVDALSLVAGHFDFSLCQRFPGLRPATILRHPADRLASWYGHLLRSEVPADQPWRALIEGRGLGLVDFVTLPAVQRVHGSAMTEQMAGYGFSDGVPAGPEASLEQAKAHLAGFAHLAIQERMADSVALARVELALDPAAELPHLNQAPEGPAVLPADVREAVARGLPLDDELYAWALEEHTSRLRAHGIAPTADDLVAAPAPAPPPLVVHRPAPAASPAVGEWLELQWVPPAGTAIGAPPGARPEAVAVPLDVPAGGAGSSFALPDPPLDDAGLNWVEVPRGLYAAQVTVTGRPDDAETDEPWLLLAVFTWCGEPVVPGAPGLPGVPEVEVWRWATVPGGLPPRPRGGTPVTLDGLVHVPEDGGHLCCLVGSNRVVRAQGRDRTTLTYVRLG